MPGASDPPLVDLLPDSDREDEAPALDLEMPWSSEAPFLSLDATEMSDYYSALQNELVREVATCLRHEKLIHFFLDDPLECLKLFPTYTWDEESDAAAEKFIQWYVQRFRAELEQQRELAWMGDDVQALAKDAANNEREILIAYDLKAGEVLFVRYGDKDSVTVHTLQQRLAEGREIVFDPQPSEQQRRLAGGPLGRGFVGRGVHARRQPGRKSASSPEN